jgi:hypothetical protein
MGSNVLASTEKFPDRLASTTEISPRAGIRYIVAQDRRRPGAVPGDGVRRNRPWG